MNKTLRTNLNHSETIWGWVYLIFQLLLLPSLLKAANQTMQLSDAELNFTFFFLNFLAILWIFHDFLGESFRQVAAHPILVMQAVILGCTAYYVCSKGITWLIGQLAPGYTNANDASIAAMSRGGYFLMALGTVVLVPPVEECLYRGLIFRKLYSVNKWAAYILSILVFAFVHIIGFLGSYSPLELAMAVLQYLPAGLCLAWAYTKADTIFAPILIHAIVNAVGISAMR